MARTAQCRIHVGIGGWNYAPWRGSFYPKGLKQADELAYAASKLTSIEINATHYRLQSKASFRKWAEATPAGFVFSIKGPRFITQQKQLAESGRFVARFFESGLSELGAKLGPVLWQLPSFKRFEEDDLAGFLALLPHEVDGVPVRHVIEAQHPSFRTPAFPKLLRDFNAAAALIDSEADPAIADLTADIVYARLQRGSDAVETGYPPEALAAWAERGRLWANGGVPTDLAPLDTEHAPERRPRNVFIYFIREGKLRAPAAAMALIARLNEAGSAWEILG